MNDLIKNILQKLMNVLTWVGYATERYIITPLKPLTKRVVPEHMASSLIVMFLSLFYYSAWSLVSKCLRHL